MSSQSPILPAILDKKPIVFLLGVWGKSYIQSFFDFGLRSLLAPGNIPALSQEYACTFLFLTTDADVPFFKSQPAFLELTQHCSVEFIEISDLIFNGNYSATLTFAYERGMRSRGEKMCSTYFFFLVSDYLMADGSLHNIGRYLKAGYSGITTGNFLVVEEYISPVLQEKMTADASGRLVLNAREMLSLAFPFIHPVSLGHTVTQSFTHATHANRLFWKVDDHTMIGRFYLRHMLCIKPELSDFIIGASCDYSFIPEMCPSGNIFHIQDSDDYCVIEMAPFDYEQPFLASGKHEIPRLAAHLSEWTTPVHRANAHIPVIYHSEPLPEPPLAMLQTSGEFVVAIESRMDPQTKPIRGHEYWISCIQSIVHNALEEKKPSERPCTINGFIRSPTFFPVWGNNDDRHLLKTRSSLLSSKPRKARLHEIMIGTSYQVSFWHQHWFDDCHLKQDLQTKLADRADCVAITFDPTLEIMQWIEHGYPGQCTYLLYAVMALRSPHEIKELFLGKKHIFIWLAESHFNKLGSAIRSFAPYLGPDNTISVYFHPKRLVKKRHFEQRLSIWNADLMNSQIVCDRMQSYYNIPQALLQSKYARYSQKLFAPRKHLWTRLIGFIGLSLFDGINLIGNLLAISGIQSKKKVTSAIAQFKKLSP